MQDIRRRPTLEEIYGNYKKPQTLVKLEEVSINYPIDLYDLWCGLYTNKPYIPAPLDIIPFSHTGGDGCYFGFLTDFGYYDDLEEAPIVFICPADFDESYPHHANKLFANNIREFLSVIITLKYTPEFLRFKSIYEIDIDGDKEMAEKSVPPELFEHWETPQLLQAISILKEQFGIEEIKQLEEYFILIDMERKSQHYLDTKDGIGIKSHLKNEIRSVDFSDRSTLAETLAKVSKVERLKFYRNAPYIYPHFNNNFLEIMEVMTVFLEQDGFHREANILKLEREERIKWEEYSRVRRIRLEQHKQ